MNRNEGQMAERQPGAAVYADDLTAKARIRNAALELFAAQGVDATSLRAIAAAAGVTVGLIVHHYGTKEALRESVELGIVQQFAETIASVPLASRPADEIAAARDHAVADMLSANQAIVDYLRRAILDGRAERGDLVSRLSQLSAQQVHDLRQAGVASTKHAVGEQVITIMVRQLGRLFLQPLVDRIAEEFDDDMGSSKKPQLVVDVTP
ncbi:TetR/AcrR family transcriptional regulator [Microbacterium sp. UBA837]|uniref:TetR/AcrR family transcriptional regulator n=1 Tax=Microbacterium sp. UBA837 TaxID=1946956 RepID=UPI0025E5DACB|nr:TetR/AcrR family transcriptional regulator [Microbacterium sp. UBA837]|tara:strand:+ start:953 stop:1579 length:627 start_codon:yes stop_codon:yes gene_type:complete